MPSRKFHTKSRHGCVQCKARRIRCDCDKPICANCVRKGCPCSFQTQTASNTPAASPAATASTPTALPPISWDQASSSQTPPTQNALPITPTAVSDAAHTPNVPSIPPPPTLPVDPALTPPKLDLDSLGLMHHYTAVLAPSLSERASIAYLWQHVVPEIAISQPFLMHGILAISALHIIWTSNPKILTTSTAENNGLPIRTIQRTKPSSYYRTLAMTHQNVLLSSLRRQLNIVSRDNCSALFAASSFIAICPLASHQADVAVNRAARSHTIDLILDVAELMRGVHSLVQQSWTWVATGPLREMLRPGLITDRLDRTEDPDGSMARLEEFIRHAPDPSTSSTDGTTKDGVSSRSEAYLMAVSELRKTVQTVRRHEDDIDIICIWLLSVSQQYLELLQARDRVAMVILAHWGVQLHHVRRVWWIGGLGAEVVEEVYRHLVQVGDIAAQMALASARESVGMKVDN